jgi:hypothetical protein
VAGGDQAPRHRAAHVADSDESGEACHLCLFFPVNGIEF